MSPVRSALVAGGVPEITTGVSDVDVVLSVMSTVYEVIALPLSLGAVQLNVA